MKRALKVAIYTSITASKDSLKAPADSTGADLVLFSDQLRAAPGWNVRAACNLFTDPRRNSRAHKILAHQYLTDYDYSLWLDGSMRLLVPVHDLIERYLDQTDIALFRHPERDCLYEEAAICMDRRLDDGSLIMEQVSKYKQTGYPSHNGLYEAGVLLRRHSTRIEHVNNAWWSEFCRHARRDQLSLTYVLHHLGIRPAIIDPHHGYHCNVHGPVSYEGHEK